MHILLIHQAFTALDEPGGTRHYELASYLLHRGHSTTIITSPVSYLTGAAWKTNAETSASPAGSGLDIRRVAVYPALHRSFVHRVISFLSFMIASFTEGLRVRQVDVVWGTSPPIFQAVTAWALARLKRVPFLLEVRDLWPEFAVQVGVLRQPVLIRLSEWLERFLYRKADLVLVNSPGFAQHVTQRGAKGVVLVPNGADVDMFDPDADGAVFRQVNHLEGKFVLLYAGAHGMSNDLTVLLDAAQILQDDPAIAILLVGDGKEKSALQQFASEKRLTNVIFLPPVTKSEMPAVLAAADACLAILKPIPLYATVYPNKVFDYMAAGRPVVLAIDGVIRQLVESAAAGIFTPPGDAQALAETIRQLAGDRQLGREMGLAGRKIVEERFDRRSLADQFAEIIEDLGSQ
jgi:glycosyltransferase involved in cell wall biosynthesis